MPVAKTKSSGSIVPAVMRHFDAEAANFRTIAMKENGGEEPAPYTHQEYPKAMYTKEYFSTKDENVQHSFYRSVDNPDQLKQAQSDGYMLFPEAKKAYEDEKKAEKAAAKK